MDVQRLLQRSLFLFLKEKFQKVFSVLNKVS